jgi:hypothetical protein
MSIVRQLSMNIQRIRLAFLLLLACAAGFGRSHAQQFNPETILLSDFTFARPQSWVWLQTRGDLADVIQSVSFQVNYRGKDDGSRAVLNHFMPDKSAGRPESVVQRWKEWFVDAPGPLAFGKPRTIGKTRISYLEITGSYNPGDPKKGPSLKNHKLLGALVEHAKGNLVMRLIGPAASVTEAEPEFKQMIENALHEE